MADLNDDILRLQSQLPGSLERKLQMRGDALWDIGSNLHEIFRHPGVFETCPNENCLGLRGILNLTQADTSTLFSRR